MAKALGLIGKKLLGLKLALPSGVKLNDNEAKYVIDDWKEQKRGIYNDVDNMKTLSADIERRVANLVEDIPVAKDQFEEAKKKYRDTKDPLGKRRWAMKLVLRSRYYDYMVGSRLMFESTTERIKDTIEDASVHYNTLENQIQDAEIFRRLNGGLQLVGKALIDAKNKQRMTMPQIEFQNLEFTMEKIEQEISKKPDANLIEEADALLGQREIKR